MGTVDFFTFPVREAQETGLFDMSTLDLRQALDEAGRRNAAEGIDHGMAVFFDPRVLHGDHNAEILGRAASAARLSYSVLVGPHEGADFLQRAQQLGIRSITLHPYLQEIEGGEDWVLDTAREADRLGLFLCVCCAYGGRSMYRIEPLRVAAAVAEAVDCPVVIVHGGGARVREALLIADAHDNVYLDTSFSLHWWQGSSVETDFAFAMRKLGCERWLFGSDAPFVALPSALQTHRAFFERHGFAEQDQQNIMGTTASRLLRL